MTVDSYGIVKSFDIFKHQTIGMIVIGNSEAVQPFSLDQRVERFDTGIVVWISFLAVAKLKTTGSVTIRLCHILTAAIRVENQGKHCFTASFCFIDCINHTGHVHGLRKSPGNDLAGIQIHDTCKVYESVKGPNISNVSTPDSVGTAWIKSFIKNIVQLDVEIGILCCLYPWFYPLSPETGLPHVFANSTFRDTEALLLQFTSDFRGSVILLGAIVDLADLHLDSILALT